MTVKVGVELSGRLVDGAGNPVKTHYLAAIDPDLGPHLPASTMVDAEDGSFTIRALLPGLVRLQARLGAEYVDLGEFEVPARDVVVTVPDR